MLFTYYLDKRNQYSSSDLHFIVICNQDHEDQCSTALK